MEALASPTGVDDALREDKWRDECTPTTMLAGAEREQLVTLSDLRVLAILYLQPGCLPAVRLVRAERPLGDDALQIALAGRGTQIASALRDVIQAEQPPVDLRNNAQ